MKTYTQEELKLIIEKHGKWLRSEEGGERANLRSADLSYADLSYADLSSANLGSANLRSADLRYANLGSANLSSADLRYADLSYANSLWSTIGNGVNVRSLQTNNWVITYTDKVMQIGCQKHLIVDWFKFSDEEIGSMDAQALVWWKEWKPIIKKIIKVSPCKPTGFIETKE